MTENKRTFKQTVLNRYAEAGYLDFGSDRISARDRVDAGSRLYVDFVLGGISSVGASDMSKIKVDGQGSIEQSLRCIHHQDCYNKAMRAVPKEFWPIVRLVCVEDKEIKVSGSAIDVKRKLYAARVDLCRGLDRLVQFYFGKR